MLPTTKELKETLKGVIASRHKQGYETKGLQTELERLKECDGYDVLAKFADRLDNLEFRKDWRYVEPESLEDIRSECPSGFRQGPLASISPDDAEKRVAAAFEASVAGCILGKPLEFDPTLDDIKNAAEQIGEWPIRDYIPRKMLDVMGKEHGSAATCCRENIRFVEQDDDLNYTIVGMRMLEMHGKNFSRVNLGNYWLSNLPLHLTWGPERKFLIDAGMRGLHHPLTEEDIDRIVLRWNPGDEACGAAIRVDSYGFACPGNPSLAAELAWRDSSMTHRRTGVYSSMFIAAAIATAPVADKPLDIFDAAIGCIPAKSRFAEIMRDSLGIVAKSDDWLQGYRAINKKYGQYRHCQLYQECAHLINTAKFAKDTAEAISIQVSQGCDTDCFAKIAGSIMGAFFGPGHLHEKWLQIFNDDFRTSLAEFQERSLKAVTRRIAKLHSLA